MKESQLNNNNNESKKSGVNLDFQLDEDEKKDVIQPKNDKTIEKSNNSQFT